jgi:hypothetical protein
LTRIEAIIKQVGRGRNHTSRNNSLTGSITQEDDGKPVPIQADWLVKDEEGNRQGPPATVNNATKSLYDLLVQMDESTVPTRELI